MPTGRRPGAGFFASASWRSSLHALALAVVLASLRLDRLPAQARAASAIRGVVLDTIGHPVQGVDVSLGGTAVQAISDSAGNFLLRDLVPGRYKLTARRVGFDPLYLNANVFAGDTIDARLVLHGGVVRLDPVVTDAAALDRPVLREFEARRKTGIGHFFTRAEIEQHPGDRLSEMLRRKAPQAQYIPRRCGGVAVASMAGVGASAMSIDAVTVIKGDGSCPMPMRCYYQIIVDGSRVYAFDKFNTPPNIDDYLIDQIEAIEVYDGAAQTPAEYNATGSACGTVVIWSKR
jgi:hypothetical protein